MNMTTAEILLLCATGGLVGMLIIILGLLRSALDAQYRLKMAHRALHTANDTNAALLRDVESIRFLSDIANQPPARLWEPDSHWTEHPTYPRNDWAHEVANNDTGASYVEWVNTQLENE